jgi:hypothetical protein
VRGARASFWVVVCEGRHESPFCSSAVYSMVWGRTGPHVLLCIIPNTLRTVKTNEVTVQRSFLTLEHLQSSCSVYPQWRKQLAESDAVMRSSTPCIAPQSASRVRQASERSDCLTLAKIISIGFSPDCRAGGTTASRRPPRSTRGSERPCDSRGCPSRPHRPVAIAARAPARRRPGTRPR